MNMIANGHLLYLAMLFNQKPVNLIYLHFGGHFHLHFGGQVFIFTIKSYKI